MTTSSEPAQPTALDDRVGARRGLALAVISSAIGLDVSSIGVVNAAMPAMASSLGMSPSVLQWVVTGYSLAFAGVLLCGGQLADAFDRRAVFCGGVALFAAGSVVAAIAPVPLVLLAARVLQGVGAAVSVPAALALLTRVFPPGPARDRALGVYAAVGAASFGVGIVVGGILADFLGWRSVFVLNLLLAVAVLVGAWMALPSGGSRQQRLDLPGTVLATPGLLLLVFALGKPTTLAWTSPLVVASGLLGVALLAGFVVWERRAADPLLPASLVRLAPVRAASLAGFLFFGAVSGVLFFAPLYMQGLLGWTPFESALSLLPLSVVVVVSCNVAGRLLGRMGQRPMFLTGLALIGVGVSLWILTPLDGTYLANLLPALTIMSIGQGFAFTGFTAASLTGVPQEGHGVAGALNVTFQQIGAGVWVAVLVTIAAAAQSGSTPTDVLHGYHVAFICSAAAVLVGIVLLALLPPLRYRQADYENTPARRESGGDPG